METGPSGKDLVIALLGAFILSFIITQYVFPVGKEDAEASIEETDERPYYESYPAYIREVTFEGNAIKHIIINNEMLNSTNTVFRVEPVASDDKTNRTYYVSGSSHAIVFYKNGLDDFIKDYRVE